jgi:chemotaxis protein methyltransferase CheR
MLTDRQFNLLQKLAFDLAGIQLVERHRELLTHRLRRAAIADDRAMDLLFNAVKQGETTATERLLGLLTTKVTGFFRHPRHFDLAAEHAFHVARQRGSARLWSAGAATGEEPYSLGIRLIEVFGQDEPAAEILATDIDRHALASAERGEYAESALRALAPVRRQRFFHQAGPQRSWSVAALVRKLVRFRVVNLVDVAWSLEQPFDVIFCRNVLMYFEACHRYSALERMSALLAPGGLLFLDPTEHLGKAEHLFAGGARGVYSSRRSPRQFHPSRKECTPLQP